MPETKDGIVTHLERIFAFVDRYVDNYSSERVQKGFVDQFFNVRVKILQIIPGLLFAYWSAHLAACRTMSNPRSSRRIGARIATSHVDDEIEISSSLMQNDSVDDRA